MGNLNYKNPQEALDFVKRSVGKMEAMIKASDSVIKQLIDQNTRLEIENKYLQDRNNALRAESEAFARIDPSSQESGDGLVESAAKRLDIYRLAMLKGNPHLAEDIQIVVQYIMKKRKDAHHESL
ncbi:hypothetical protein [Eubacterium callanderi]|uniref:hypothetical protein n=1 Tax=Eubacterium callanderi TaxID=53442 RepID=UPI001D14ADCD|nr:hypothetical protein [Eubacterium callanderi]MCC3401085.1 hypothetical protein [Eubacterium callanderi]